MGILPNVASLLPKKSTGPACYTGALPAQRDLTLPHPMKTFAHHILSACLALLAVASLHAQTVTMLTVGKVTENVQTDAVTTAVRPASGGYGGGWGFNISVEGTSLSAPTVTIPAGTGNNLVNALQHNGGVLGFNAGNQDWEYGFPNFDNIGTTTSTDRNTRFPNGIYSFAIPSLSTVSLNLQNPTNGGNTVPLFTVTGGAWSGGNYVVNANQALTITSNTFTNFSNMTGNVLDSAIEFGVYDNNGNPLSGSSMFYFYSDNHAASNVMSYTINANTLTSGMNYTVFGANLLVVDKNALNSSLNLAYFESSTIFTVSAIPEPSAYAAFAGLGALGLAVWRRRRSRV
jgi:hypothetical protein